MDINNKELHHHYHKRLRICRNIICNLANRDNNIKWNTFVSYFNYYDSKLRTLDKKIGKSTSGGGNYKSQIEEATKPERRNVGNYHDGQK